MRFDKPDPGRDRLTPGECLDAVEEWAVCAVLLGLIIGMCLAASGARAASAVPPQRLARQLPADRAAAVAARARHNAALSAFFSAAGLPSGLSAPEVAGRARAIEELCAALTNGTGRASSPVPLLRRLQTPEQISGPAVSGPAENKKEKP